MREQDQQAFAGVINNTAAARAQTSAVIAKGVAEDIVKQPGLAGYSPDW